MFSSYKMRGIILLRKVGVIMLLSELYIKFFMKWNTPHSSWWLAANPKGT
jgi:hypothetical protein